MLSNFGKPRGLPMFPIPGKIPMTKTILGIKSRPFFGFTWAEKQH